MSYQQKYLKYKSKYLDLKKQLGGTKEENNNYLLHGTNLFYIDDIKVNGLNGIYNQEIYDIIEKYWPTMHRLARDSYVHNFIQRQRKIRSNNIISLSFTGQSFVAKEYGTGSRSFGEGPTFFLRTLREYMDINKEHIDADIIKDYNFLYNVSKYPGIILAINKDDFSEIRDLLIENLDEREYILKFPIPADKLYIRINENDYIPLLSQEGIEYTDKLKSDFLKEGKRLKEEAERIKQLDGWDTKTFNSSDFFYYEINKKNRSIFISAQYSIINEKEIPHSLSIIINNYSNINIEIIIKNILGTSDYVTETNKMIGFDLFMSNNEFKDKLKLAIEGVMNDIPPERKEKIYEKVIEIFPYLV